MVDLSKYTLTGTYIFENIQNQLGTPFPEINIGTCGNSYEFYLKLRETNINDRLVLYPCLCNVNEPTIRIRYYFNILKADGSSSFTLADKSNLESWYQICGVIMDVEELINGGFLINGGLKIEYGVHVEAALDQNGIWNFNFEDPFFYGNYLTANVVNEGELKDIYYHRQIASLHFNSDPDIFHNQPHPIVEQILLFSHGVRQHLVFSSELDQLPFFAIMLFFSVEYDIRNVARFAEFQLMYSGLGYTEAGFYTAIDRHRPRYLAHLLRLMSRKEIICQVKRYNIKEMTGETMKQLTRFLLEL